MLSDRKKLIKALKVSHSLTQRFLDGELSIENNPELLLTVMEQQGKIEKLITNAENNKR